jgi:exosortase/archaeosortase family protein
LYAYVRDTASLPTRLALVASALPIAIFTNILRVIALVLITYYYGDAAGRGAHDILGIAIFVAALAMLLGVERLGAAIQRRRK